MNQKSVFAGALVACAGFWACTAGYIAVGSIKDSPLRLSHGQRMNLLSVAPEGWSFFTRNPREERLHIFAPAADAGWRLDQRKNADASSLFGIRRASRTRYAEISPLIKDLPPERWVACEADVHTCAASAPEALAVTNTAARPSLCGRVLLQLQEPVPWAWSRSQRRSEMPSKILNLEVACP